MAALAEKAALLTRLNEQKFLTTRERRDAKILSEYQFLLDRPLAEPSEAKGKKVKSKSEDEEVEGETPENPDTEKETDTEPETETETATEKENEKDSDADETEKSENEKEVHESKEDEQGADTEKEEEKETDTEKSSDTKEESEADTQEEPEGDTDTYAKNYLDELSAHLKEVLQQNMFELPVRLVSETKETADHLAKVQDLLDSIKNEPDMVARERSMRNNIAPLVQHEEAMLLFEEVGGEKQVAAMLNAEDPQPYLLGIIASLTYHKKSRRSLFPTVHCDLLIGYLCSTVPKVREYAAHILANYSYEMRLGIRDSVVPLLSNLLVSHEEEQQGFQALRCLTNLAIEETHRKKLLQLPECIASILMLLKSSYVELQAQGAWALANLASPAFSHGAETVSSLINLAKSPNATVQFHSIRALANYACLSEFTQFFKGTKILEILKPLLESPDTSVQEETVRCFSQLMSKGVVKDLSFTKSLALTCVAMIDLDNDLYDERICVQAAWCLAYITNSVSECRSTLYEKEALQYILSLLEEGPTEARVPAVWCLCGLSEYSPIHHRYRDLDLIRPLVQYLFQLQFKEPATKALANLAADEKNRRLIGQFYSKFAVQEPLIMARVAKDTRGGSK
eukprot:TRINITY_DN7299_c0_g1_i1.p1 TRINITY_DN7299_c0_g1~~TRINITY_DN7299_c0_g1_i1.p1  ORF type:complete len:628 (+),score=152.52 TRINITY_DN7299_c0_g1_i1:1812-3695(+)